MVCPKLLCPQFTATEFEHFCSSNGILHRTSAVYKPSTNGQAERVVQFLKSAIKQAHLTNADVDTVIANYLLVYRTTPHSTTGEPPSLLLMGQRLRNRLDLLTPSLETHVEARQYSTMVSRTADRGLCKFNAGDSVLARNFGRGGKWVRGVVTEVLGSRHYIVKVAGNLWKRHIDQLLRRPADVASTRGFSASNYQSMPLDVSPDMDQPYEIVPDSTIPSTYIPPTATLDESILASTGDSPVPNKQPAVSMPVTDPPMISQPTTLPETSPEISDAANDDGTLVVQPNSLCEYPADAEKRYPTRTTRRPPRHLKDYDLK